MSELNQYESKFKNGEKVRDNLTGIEGKVDGVLFQKKSTELLIIYVADGARKSLRADEDDCEVIS